MNINLPQYTLRNLYDNSVRLYGHLPAIAFVGEEPLTYNHLDRRMKELALLLNELGVGRGDRVALLGENSPHWVIAYWAITYMGAVVVPILPGFTDSDTRHILRHSEAKAAFISNKLKAKLEDLESPDLQHLISLEDFSLESAKSVRASILATTIYYEKKGTQIPPYDEERCRRLPAPAEEDLAAIIYTSGTTGNSKGVMLTHRNIAFNVVRSIERFPIDSRDRFLSILPLSHAFEATGGMLCPLAVGVAIYYMDGVPTPAKLLSAMEAVKPTGVLTVPLVVDKIFRKRILPQIQSKKLLCKLYPKPFFRARLHKVAGKKLITSLGGNLRFFMFGGAALNADVETFLRDAGISYSSGYGMTETSPILTINPFGKVKPGSCGCSIPGIEIEIDHPDPATGIGEIIVRGSSVMKGYYKNESATRETFTSDGWLKTGDLGYFDTEGYLFIKGRSKNVIVGPSGENIYPELIEQTLLLSPYILEAVVVFLSGRLKAKVYLDYDLIDQDFSRNHLNPEDAARMIQDLLEKIRQEINEKLPAFSRLQELIEHQEPFEKTPTNKVKRHLYLTELS